MTKDEMMQRMKELETLKFYLEMKDRWSNRDYEQNRKWMKEYNELKARLAEM